MDNSMEDKSTSPSFSIHLRHKFVLLSPFLSISSSEEVKTHSTIMVFWANGRL